MATPYVVGLAGLLLSVNPTLTVSQLQERNPEHCGPEGILEWESVDRWAYQCPCGVGQRGGKLHRHSQQYPSQHGTVRSEPVGMTCRATCNGQFPLGSTVTLTAAPDSGSVFAGWSGDCAGTRFLLAHLKRKYHRNLQQCTTTPSAP